MSDKLAYGHVSEIIQSYMDDTGTSFAEFQRQFNRRVKVNLPIERDIQTYVKTMVSDHYGGNKDAMVKDLFRMTKTLKESFDIYTRAKAAALRLRSMNEESEDKPWSAKLNGFIAHHESRGYKHIQTYAQGNPPSKDSLKKLASEHGVRHKDLDVRKLHTPFRQNGKDYLQIHHVVFHKDMRPVGHHLSGMYAESKRPWEPPITHRLKVAEYAYHAGLPELGDQQAKLARKSALKDIADKRKVAKRNAD